MKRSLIILASVVSIVIIPTVAYAIVLYSVTTNAATSISSTAATFNATATCGGDCTGTFTATKFGFVYGTDSTLSTTAATTTEQTVSGPDGGTPYSLTESPLSCGTTYYFKAYVDNTAISGTYNYGSILNFTTSACSSGDQTSQMMIMGTF